MESDVMDKVREAYAVLLKWETDDFKARRLLQEALRNLRNCDVGTIEEQAKRFHNFCVSNSSSINGMCDPKCPCIASPDQCYCMCKWAQMPYKDEARKEGVSDGK